MHVLGVSVSLQFDINLIHFFPIISGLLAGVLSKHVSPRITIMSFGLLSSAGLIVASIAHSISMLSVALIFTGKLS